VNRLWQELRSALGVALAAGVLTGLFLGVWSFSLNDLAAWDLPLLVFYLSALYACLNGAVLLPVAAVCAALPFRPGPRVYVAATLAWYVVLNGATRYISAVQPLSVVPHLSAIGALDAGVVLLAALAVAAGVSTRRTGLGLGAALLLVAALELVHSFHEPTPDPDLSRLALSGSGAGRPEVFGTAPDGERLDRTQLAVLGLDGLSWDVLLPLLDRGELQNFRALLDGAAYGPLETLSYSRSPLLWEAISTGRRPLDHGIGDHAHLEFAGLSRRLVHLPHFRLSNSPMAAHRLLLASRHWAPWRSVAANATDARAARFWEVASRAGIPVGVYQWYNTTPVAPVRGFIRGRGAIPPLIYPPELAELAPVPRVPKPRSGPGWVEQAMRAERAQVERFLGLAQRFQPPLLVYYTHFADGVNHLNWKREAYGDGFFISGVRKPEFEPGPTITPALRFLDTVLGEVMRRIPADATLLVVSDHGFDFRGYEHDNAPPGVFIARSPAIDPGLLEGASVYDVAPTILHVLGLPVADDMVGAPLAIARTGSPLDRAPTRVGSHGPAATPLAPGRTAADAAREHEEYLKALGYVN
jgi:hypothetical protein